MRIVMIGTGNTATVLARCMIDSGHEVVQVYGRQESIAKKLADSIGASYTTNPGNLVQTGDLYVVAITDDALTNIHEWLALGRKLVVHTAGSVSKEVLQQVSSNYGVLYPLQSLRREMKHLPAIPFLVDGNTPEDLTLLYDFAKSLSVDVEVANDEKRRKLHLAAVLVNNFTNHLYAMAELYSEKNKINFQLLLPLIEETASRLRSFPAIKLQTGPAVRNDLMTIEQHLEMLEKFPELKSIYTSLTNSIQQLNHRQHL